MRFSLFTLALATTSFTSAAILKNDAAPITDALAAVTKAVIAQDALIVKFPTTASFETYDEAGDALTDRLKDLETIVQKSPKLGAKDSNRVIDALVELIPVIEKGLKLIVDKKSAFAAEEGAAAHIKEELEEDQKQTKLLSTLLAQKLTISDPLALVDAGTKMAQVFQTAIKAYEGY